MSEGSRPPFSHATWEMCPTCDVVHCGGTPHQCASAPTDAELVNQPPTTLPCYHCGTGIPVTGSMVACPNCQWTNFLYGPEAVKPPVRADADMVNHPPHYTSHPSGVECIDVVEHYDFLLGNIIKYAWRAGLKEGSSRIDDLRKCAWYAQRAVEKEQREIARLEQGKP